MVGGDRNSGHPLRAEACAELIPAMSIRLRTTELAGRKEGKFELFDVPAFHFFLKTDQCIVL